MNADVTLPALSTVDDPTLRARIEDFLYLEADLLDEWRVDEWFALFAEGATYEIPPTGEADEADPATSLF
jgi:p-cumate 2,3-dioxygenase beta subunit